MKPLLFALVAGTSVFACGAACAQTGVSRPDPTAPGPVIVATALEQSPAQGEPAATTAPGQPATEKGASGKGSVGAGSTAAASSSPDLGSGVFQRFINYNKLEWGQSGPPADPNAPSSRRAGWTPAPENSPPYPFTEWSYGGTTSLGVNRASSVDSPLMVALAPTGVGQLLNDAHVQAYGWVNVGANLSTSSVKQGNSPAAYDFNPNAIQLDQAVLYIERTPDTVQTDHVDWGFRISGIYGTDYRYTTSYGLFSYQLLKHNRLYGYDAPMEYLELYVPQLASGLLIRVGRFISLPDIEAQLAPNNYTYSHSITYTFDNYTNTGVQATLALNKNLFVQLGASVGSDTAAWNAGKHITNPFPNVLYPGSTYLKDPGARPSGTACVRYQTDSARDNIYLCADAINNGVWGYNNLQWYGLTYYHKFNDKWHVSFETYNLHESNVPNINNPAVANIVAMGGTPFSPQNIPFNAPDEAQCKNVASLKCTATAQSALAYLNYQFSPLDNLSVRTEYYNDMEGQRTGVVTQYVDFAVSVQHWLSPQIELRPEIAYYSSLDRPAFNGDSNGGIAPNKSYEFVLSGDVIAHF